MHSSYILLASKKTQVSRITQIVIFYGLPAGALVMLYDIANCEDDEAAALLRLTVLRNYLIRTEKRISAEGFSYMCQELLGI